MSKKNRMIVVFCIIAAVLIALVPMLMLPGAEFGGSDDAGSDVVAEVDEDYEAWFTPVLETLIGGELPGEIESLFFCIQTGIGVGVLFFFLGRFYERRKWMTEKTPENTEKSEPPEMTGEVRQA